MNNITEHIQNRRSVRTFDGRGLAKNDLEKLASYAKAIENPYKIPPENWYLHQLFL